MSKTAPLIKEASHIVPTLIPLELIKIQEAQRLNNILVNPEAYSLKTPKMNHIYSE